MHATNPACMVRHWLSAYTGEEITTEVFEEAENRLHAQKAVMVMLME